MTTERVTSSTALPSGAVFGSYYLTRKIGHGGMAEVFLGRHLDLGPAAPPRVLKCILPDLVNNPQFLAMFINEAQLAAQMNHPNIVQVLEFGEVEGRVFMVMEYVEGLDCWRFARRLHPWGDDHTAIAVSIVCQVLEALEYAHTMTDVNGQPLGVIHRDLSPSNIYLSLQGDVKLGDFGIAQIDSSRYRQIPMIPKGKFGYVAPEQVEGQAIDQRADIFAVGVVLAELLIGKKMFSGQSQLSVMLEIKEARLDALEQNVDRVEPALLDILHGALARKPADRYASANELKHVLTEYLDVQRRVPSSQALGQLVTRAVELADSGSITAAGAPITGEITPVDLTSVAPSSVDPPTPITEEQDKTPLATDFYSAGAMTTPEQGTPVTRDSSPFENEWQYTARLSDGRMIGPSPYAHIIELICSDDIGPDTPISVDGRLFVPASRRPELTRHLPVYTPTCDVTELETPDRRGVLQLETPGEVILTLALNLESGMLVCKQGLKRKEVYFEEGQPVYVSSNDPKELLGEYLVSRGAIDSSELELALALLPKFNGHMGDTLIALGMLSAIDLFNYIGDQIRNRFRDLIVWNYGHYEFYRGVSCRPDVFEVSLDPFAIVAECVLGSSAKIPVKTTLETMADCTVAPSSLTSGLLARLQLPREIADILQDLIETCSLRDLADGKDDPDSQRTLVQALYIATEIGLWIIEGVSPPWRATENIKNT